MEDDQRAIRTAGDGWPPLKTRRAVAARNTADLAVRIIGPQGSPTIMGRGPKHLTRLWAGQKLRFPIDFDANFAEIRGLGTLGADANGRRTILFLARGDERAAIHRA